MSKCNMKFLANILFLFLLLSFSNIKISAQNNRFDYNGWVTGSTDLTNTVGTCTMRTQVSGSNFLNSAPRFDDTGVTYSPTNGEGLALDHDWTNLTTSTTVTLTYSPAITNPTFSIFDINRNNPCAIAGAWTDRVTITTTPAAIINVSQAQPSEQTVSGSGSGSVTITGNMVCNGVNGAVTINITGNINTITITYSSGPTVNINGGSGSCGNPDVGASCFTTRTARTDPGRQFITIGSVSGSTCCLGAPVGQRNAPTGAQCSATQLNFSSAPTGNNGTLSYLWNSTIPVSSGTASTFNVTPVNNGITDITTSVTLQVTSNVSSGVNRGRTVCPASFSPTIRPIPTVNDPADQNLCNGLQTAVNYTGNGVAGTVFNWSNNNTAIGLPATGSGNISAFNAAAGTASVTVTPTANGCTGASQVFNFNIDGCNLPVEFLYFNGRKEKEGFHYLYWATATESKCAFYEIEKSLNALDFETVGMVNSLSENGNSTVELNYDFYYRPKNNLTHYYRLKQLNHDGSFSYSNVIALAAESDRFDFSLYPIPANQEIILEVPVDFSGQSYHIYNILGQKAKRGIIRNSYNIINLEGLDAGSYILVMDNGAYSKIFSKK